MMKRVNFIIIFVGVVTTILLAGCMSAPMQPEVLEPSEPLYYNFAFSPNDTPANKLGITIGILGSDWGKEPVTYDAGFAVQSNERLLKPNMIAQRGPLPIDASNLLQEFDKAVANDYESMMVRRGFNTMRFQKIDDMTYPEKQSCNLVLYPEFHMTIKSSTESVGIDEVKGNAIITGEFVLNILEPMSREKLWMKRISVQSEPFAFKYAFNYQPLYDTKSGEAVGYDRQGIKWDNRGPRLAKALTKFYSELMQTSWRYFSPEELIAMKKHSDDLRERKRY